MDSTAEDLASYLVQQLKLKAVGERLLVAIAGVPASGKSTLAELVVAKINALLAADSATHPTSAILVGLDGWHLTRAQLDAMPDPRLAHDRRGAHWTFDGPSYVEFAKLLRQPATAVITAPSFDHAMKDPTPHAVSIYPSHRLVVIEGAQLMDERWWVQVGLEEARRRLVKRHVLTGVAKDMEEAIWRAGQNDEPNGKFIAENLYQPTRIIESLDDPKYTL
ncbi:P-loop containing nucleoside triphosphate hydrolase protein [Suillus paluster]|uniref:P-loop containing nucleoside triphosphate hydrolase protein n=1 Tax=Suillus paluster TaxID=48578 RepID=UPI001B86D4A3|nr:P-loop containing nucleoside triphosphate hydrolase protein [Suillus paluster]KAG1741797.1 P-loop containing nucleoside triphosphate hydrolase protein [Suillus paluster]